MRLAKVVVVLVVVEDSQSSPTSNHSRGPIGLVSLQKFQSSTSSSLPSILKFCTTVARTNNYSQACKMFSQPISCLLPPGFCKLFGLYLAIHSVSCHLVSCSRCGFCLEYIGPYVLFIEHVVQVEGCTGALSRLGPCQFTDMDVACV